MPKSWTDRVHEGETTISQRIFLAIMMGLFLFLGGFYAGLGTGLDIVREMCVVMAEDGETIRGCLR